MLDRLKLFKILEKEAADSGQKMVCLFEFLSGELSQLLVDHALQKKLSELAPKLGVPLWKGEFGRSQAAKVCDQDYSVLAVDGSQVLPDRHSFRPDLALIQIGGIKICYSGSSSASREQKLELIKPSSFGPQAIFDQTSVQQLRDVLELETALEWAKDARDKPVVFMDGSLAFLLSRFSDPAKTACPSLAKRFLAAFEGFAKAGIDLVFYTSVPSTKTFSGLIKQAICSAAYFDRESCTGRCGQASCNKIYQASDSDLFGATLPEWSASQEFVSTICDLSFKTFFVSTHNPDGRWFGETARVEFFGQDKNIEVVLAKVFDQIKKGFGFPVGVAEAHEQAVLTHSDKEVFAQLLENAAGQKPSKVSAKLFRKRAPIF